MNETACYLLNLDLGYGVPKSKAGIVMAFF
ncbi:MAG: hypothetical protein JWO06_2107 [Bacteroidota bacterium]|nr:hypothetical protein [Bacteroidota bacterium]